MERINDENKIKKLFSILANSLDHYDYIEIVDLMLEVNLGHPYFLDMSNYSDKENVNFSKKYVKPGDRKKLFQIINGGKID